MLAVVQFPIVDGRLFCGVDRLPKPVWESLSEGADFVRRFGGARRQTDFESVPVPWRDDAQYVSAKWAIRLCGKPLRQDLALIGEQTPRKQPFWTYRAPEQATNLCFAPAFRRLHSDGVALARVDIGFWVFGATAVGGKDVLCLVHDLLALEAQVRQRAAAPEYRALRSQDAPLARLYWQCTRTGTTPSTEQEGRLVRHAAPTVFLDDRIGVQHLPSTPHWFRQMGRALGMPTLSNFPERASVVSVQTAGALDLAYTTLEIHERRFAVWMMRGVPNAGRDAAAASRGIRQCLLRLHAARHGLLELQRMAASGLLPYAAHAQEDPLGDYLKDLVAQVLRPTYYGANQTELQEIISLYDLGEGGNERQTLETAFNKLKLNREIKARVLLATSTRVAKEGIVNYQVSMIVNNTTQTTNINHSGSGSLTISELTQVAGDYIRQSKEFASNASDAKLREALDELRKQVDSLAKQAPDTETQEVVTRKLKQLSEEAAAKKPDSGFLTVTAKGLIDAAKTVAEMVPSVTTAVKGVLAILGLAL